MSRMMARLADGVTKRTVTKVLPHLKRTICKKCLGVLIPGLTVTIEVEGHGKGEVLIHGCRLCGATKRFPVGKDRDHVLFCDRAELKES